MYKHVFVCLNRLEQCLKDIAKSESTDSQDIIEILNVIKAENCVPQSTCDELDLQKVLKLIKQWVRQIIYVYLHVPVFFNVQSLKSMK
jgi:hypothetical protein